MEKDLETIQSSVESFCRILSAVNIGKLSPEILRKAKHHSLDENDTMALRRFLVHLCQNVICKHDYLNLKKLHPDDLFSWLLTIVSKFNIIDSLSFKAAQIYNNASKNSCLKLENSPLFLKDFVGIQTDEHAHLISFYNLKIKSFELSYFEKMSRPKITPEKEKHGQPKSSNVNLLKLQKYFRAWKDNEAVFWKWAKIEKHAAQILAQLATLQLICPICEVHVLPYFLLLNNQYLLQFKQCTEPKTVVENILDVK